MKYIKKESFLKIKNAIKNEFVPHLEILVDVLKCIKYNRNIKPTHNQLVDW